MSLEKEKYVVGIGAANVDIYGKSTIKIREKYDHPAFIKTAPGGVTRNVLENIARLKDNVKLIAAVGDDVYGEFIINKSKEAGIDTSNVLIAKDQSSAIFMQVLDDDNDMHLALCDMSVNENITLDYIKSKKELINNAEVLVFDPSLRIDVIEELLSYNSKIFLDTISDVYAAKIKPYIGKLYTLKCNKTEAEVLADMKIEDDDSLNAAADKLLATGLKRVYISLGRKGSFYKDDNICLKKALKPVLNPVNASGCGDAFFATSIHGYLNNYSNEKILDYAMAAGKATIMAESAINPKMSEELILDILKGE